MFHYAPYLSTATGEPQLSDLVQTYWAAFASTHTPSSSLPGAVPWPVFSVEGDEYLVLSSTPQVTAGLKRSQCDMWAGIVGQDSEGHGLGVVLGVPWAD